MGSPQQATVLVIIFAHAAFVFYNAKFGKVWP
jgi:hypothetical protein